MRSKRIGLWLFALLFGFLLLASHIAPVRGNDGAETVDDESEDDDQNTHTQPEPGTEPAEGAEGIEEDGEIDETQGGDGDSMLILPSRSVSTAVIFPDFAERKFTVGSEITILMGFSNLGEETFNITYVGAHLHSPFDYFYYIQNFSVRPVDVTVAPQEQVSIEYSFKPDKSLEPLEFWFSAFVLYNDTAKNVTYKNVYFNDTIELIEKQSDVNVRRIFSYFFTLTLVGLVGYAGYQMMSRKSRGRGRHRGGGSGGGSSYGGGSFGSNRTDGNESNSPTDGRGYNTKPFSPAKHSRPVGKKYKKKKEIKNKK